MTKPWFSEVPEGAALPAYWERRQAEQQATLRARIQEKLEKIDDAVQTGIITKDIGEARKKEFEKEESVKLVFFDPESVGKRIDEKNPVFLRDATTGNQIHASGKELVEKIVKGDITVQSKAMMEFFAADLGVPLERLWKETIQAEAPPKPPEAPPPAPQPAAAPTPPAPLDEEDALPPPASGTNGGAQPAPATTAPAAEVKPAETAKPAEAKPARGTRGQKAAATQPAAAPATSANGAFPDIRLTNGTLHNLVVKATACKDGSIQIHILPDQKAMVGSDGVHVRHAVCRFQESPETERSMDFETVTLAVHTGGQ